MTATIINGKEVAAEVKAEVAAAVGDLSQIPGLATVLVGDDPASEIYVRNKRKTAEKVGIRSIHHQLPAETNQRDLEELIDSLNVDAAVDAILVQLPLPAHVDSSAVIQRILPEKDADGLHPHNLGLLVLGQPGPRPCTPAGAMRLLDHYEVPLAGAKAVVVGRSFLVGRPLALMLSAKGVDATVTIAHSRTKDLADATNGADIVVAAVGVPGLITKRHVRAGATVVDVGINRVGDRVVGDVDFAGVVEVAGAITPVPGGVGPMTVAMLMVNTLNAARRRQQIN